MPKRKITYVHHQKGRATVTQERSGRFFIEFDNPPVPGHPGGEYKDTMRGVESVMKAYKYRRKTSEMVEAKKIKVEFRKGSGDGHVRMGDLVMGKAAQYKRAKWPWLKKYVKTHTGSNKPTLIIRVMVWGLDGQQNPGLMQEFGPEGLAAAKNYAKKLIQGGDASMAVVEGWFSQPYGRYAGGTIAAEFGTYERAEQMREAKDLSPEVEKKIDKIEADIKAGKISDKEGRKKIGDLMQAASKTQAEAMIEAVIGGEPAGEIIEKISGYDPRWGNTYPYAPTVRHDVPAPYDSDRYNYPLGNTGSPPRTSHETRVADSHEAEANEYMATGQKR
jgi:hypothetical protein